jgi:hypothetical protein
VLGDTRLGAALPLSQFAGHVHQQALLAGPEAPLIFDQDGIRSPSTGPPSSKPFACRTSQSTHNPVLLRGVELLGGTEHLRYIRKAPPP